MSFIYYRNDLGRKSHKKVSVGECLQNDDYRKQFKRKVRNNEDFKNNVVGWSKKPVEEYLREYDERSRVGGVYVPSEASFCPSLYTKGVLLTEKTEEEDSDQIFIETEEGAKVKVNRKLDTCPWDYSHEAPEISDDIAQINSFGEASLLHVIKRRFIEKLHIYTYVGNIVIALNPYMRLPKMVLIQQPPCIKNYQPGKDPHSYAVAHLAYWSQYKPEEYNPGKPRNQSCIVSGESGAGKTVACGLIMKYLSSLSLWETERVEKVRRSSIAGNDSHRVATLVGGVSPFLEAFGNAKTNMNDNSSRFGKFMKIFFSKGRIVGGEMEHFLLEKGRLTHQGIGERNYHIFYFLLRGASASERKKYGLMSCDEYRMLNIGKCNKIEHEADGFDAERMNLPLELGSPDETGVRAALTNAGIMPTMQQEMYSLLVSLLCLGNLTFSSSGQDGSKVDNTAVAEKAAKLLGVHEYKDANGLHKVSDLMCVYRRTLPNKIYDTPVSPKSAEDNRDALVKAIYSKLFAWIVSKVNEILAPKSGGSDAYPFVAILDIFGFEVFKKNSLEQLCINFANEKLQNIFNYHVFVEEKTLYLSEELDTSCIPKYRDNTPCCNLVEKQSRGFVGIMPYLNDVTSTSTDAKFCDELCRMWGRDGGINKKAKSAAQRASSKYFSARKGAGNDWFQIRHFAGDVKYYVKGFLHKNKDKLPEQLATLVASSKNEFLSTLFPKNAKVKSNIKNSYIVAKFKKQLSTLAHHINSTTPHYVRCIKPNDFHMRPIDGNISFDAEKTYRQLLYAGVMEICKIKKAGYPFRETYANFWSRCVEKDWNSILGLDRRMNPREGAIAVCKKALPSTIKNDDGQVMPFWAEGKTMIFGKDIMIERLTAWHYSLLTSTISGWWRYTGLLFSVAEVRRAAYTIGMKWREKYLLVRVQKMLPQIRFIQQASKMLIAHSRYKVLQRGYRLAKVIQICWRQRYAAKELSKMSIGLKIHHFREESCKFMQLFYRRYRAGMLFKKLHRMVIMRNSDKKKMIFIRGILKRVAVKVFFGRMQKKLRSQRMLIKIQSHLRGFRMRAEFRRHQMEHQGELQAQSAIRSVWKMSVARRKYMTITNSIVKINSFARMFIALTRYDDVMISVPIIQSFARMAVCRAKYVRRFRAILHVQQCARVRLLRKFYLRAKNAACVIEEFFLRLVMKKRLHQWFVEANTACSHADNEMLRSLLRCDPPYHRIACQRHEMIPYKGELVVVPGLVNIRDPAYLSSLLHSATKSGNSETVQLLLNEGADPSARDAIHETPLHCACNLGDKGLDIIQALVESSEDYSSNDPEVKWILTPEAKNFQDQTILDVALNSPEASGKCVEWLMQVGAQASYGMEKQILEELKDREKYKKFIEELQKRKNMREISEQEQDHLFKFYFGLPHSKKDRATIMVRNKFKEDSVYFEKEIIRQRRIEAVGLVQAKFRDFLKAIEWTPPDATRSKQLQREYEMRKRARQELLKRGKQNLEGLPKSDDDEKIKAAIARYKSVQTRLKYKNKLHHKEKIQKELAIKHVKELQRLREDAEEEKEQAIEQAFSPRTSIKMSRLKRMERRNRWKNSAVRVTEEDENMMMTPRQRRLRQLALLKERVDDNALIDEVNNMNSEIAIEKRKSMNIRELTDEDLNWVKRVNKDGRNYYSNCYTLDTAWSRPKPQADIMKKCVAAEKTYSAKNIDLHRELARLQKQAKSLEHRQNCTIDRRSSKSNFNDVRFVRHCNRCFSSLLKILLAYKNISSDVKGWYYINPKDKNVLGPFGSDTMKEWLLQGKIDNNLPTRCGNLGKFLPIKCYFPSNVNAFPSLVDSISIIRSVKAAMEYTEE